MNLFETPAHGGPTEGSSYFGAVYRTDGRRSSSFPELRYGEVLQDPVGGVDPGTDLELRFSNEVGESKVRTSPTSFQTTDGS